MAVDLVLHGIEVHALLPRIARDDVVTAHDPDAGAFLAARIDVARHLDGHLRIRSVQAAAMLVVKTRLAADKHFPQRPLLLHVAHAASFTSCSCLRAYAIAASRTQAPSSHASTRAVRRSRLQGPLPAMTFQNSVQSIAPKSWCCRCSFHFSSGSGSVTPSTLACSAAASTKRW